MKKQEIFDSYKDFVIPSYTKVPLVFVKGKGSYLWDIDGKKYLDLFPGWGVGNLGHCHPKVMNAVRDQVSKLVFVANNYYNLPQARLAKELGYHCQGAYKAFFCNSGAEATEAAIKISRKSGQGRFEIITFENSFHGRTLGALAATGQSKYQNGFAPLPAGFKVAKFNDIASVKAAVTENTVAVMLELIQGEGGINIASRDFVSSLRRLCDDKKMLLIIDEVQTGIGRTAGMFCWQNYAIKPDVFTLAKALGGGLPIGVMLAKKDIADCLTPGTHASTFGGGPVVCKSALAVLDAIRNEKLLANTKEMGEYLGDRLNGLKQSHPSVKEVRGMGLMWGVELSVQGKPLVEKCIEKGLLINCTHEYVLRIMPALNINKKEIDKGVSLLDSAMSELKL